MPSKAVNCIGNTMYMASKLSNSGDTLKLKVPNHSGNIMSGWTNYSGKVISLKMNESEMGYRGSKSNALAFVKEQRVDGDYFLVDNTNKLRYTLMGLEKGYQTEIPSKLDSLTINNSKSIEPWFVTGFTDAEGSFMLKISSVQPKLNWKVQLEFAIGLHKKDYQLLKDIQTFFGGIGNLRINKDTAMYSVTSVGLLLNTIIPHFESFPLKTQKQADFLLFKRAAHLIQKGEHLNKPGLLNIVNIKSSSAYAPEV